MNKLIKKMLLGLTLVGFAGSASAQNKTVPQYVQQLDDLYGADHPSDIPDRTPKDPPEPKAPKDPKPPRCDNLFKD